MIASPPVVRSGRRIEKFAPALAAADDFFRWAFAT